MASCYSVLLVSLLLVSPGVLTSSGLGQVAQQNNSTAWRQAITRMAVALIEKGDADVQRRDSAAALANYQSSLELWKLLLSKAPGDRDLQRRFSVTCNKIGDTRLVEWALPEAHDQFLKAHAISRELARLDQGNVGWQMDLVEILFRLALADALSNSERSADAPALYAEFLKLEPSLAEDDARKRAQLAVSLFKLANQGTTAKERLNEAVAIIERLEKAQKLTPTQKYWLRIIDAGRKALPR